MSKLDDIVSDRYVLWKNADEQKQAIKNLMLELVKDSQPNFDEMDDYNRSFLKAMFKGFEDELRQKVEAL